MSCGHCVRAITEAVHEADAQATVQADLASHQVTVETTATREAVVALRRATQALYAQLGGVSWQVARDYPFIELLQPDTRALLTALKQAVDPRGLMNPGSLGLGT